MKQSIILPDGTAVRPGDYILIVRMDDNGGKDTQAAAYAGKICQVSFIDDREQVHFCEGGLAVIPGLDTIKVFRRADAEHDLWARLKTCHCETSAMKAYGEEPDTLRLAGLDLYYDEGNESIRDALGRFWSQISDDERRKVVEAFIETENK